VRGPTPERRTLVVAQHQPPVRDEHVEHLLDGGPQVGIAGGGQNQGKPFGRTNLPSTCGAGIPMGGRVRAWAPG
jgi:hypothetical protein